MNKSIIVSLSEEVSEIEKLRGVLNQMILLNPDLALEHFIIFVKPTSVKSNDFKILFRL